MTDLTITSIPTTAIVTHTYLDSIAVLKAAIKAKSTTHIYITPRMGMLTLWVRVTKKQALEMIGEIAKDATPSDCEMPCGTFGTVTNFGEVYIG